MSDITIAGGSTREIPLNDRVLEWNSQVDRGQPPELHPFIVDAATSVGAAPMAVHSVEQPTPIHKELTELRTWLKNQQEQLEVAKLREIKRRVDAGDLTALDTTTIAVDRANAAMPIPSRSHLPRPEAPHVFRKKSRQDYNMWVRDCEVYHTNSPNDFISERQRVAFGIQYVAETLKTVWDQYQYQEKGRNPLWEPTWEILKQRMLDTLGTPAERYQAAYDAIKDAKQRSGQTPTELLYYLKTQWEEVDNRDDRR